jgi:hypothetical protein
VRIVRRIEEVDGVLAKAVAARAQAVNVAGSSCGGVGARIAEFAIRQRSASTTPRWTYY